MADVNFDTSITGLVKTVFDRQALNALRPELYFVDCARYEPSMLAMPGNVHTFTFLPDMAAATTPLNEVTDPDVVAITPTTKTVTLLEYGNAARSTRKFRGTTFLPAPDPEINALIGWNAGITQDTLARNVMVAGTNVTYGGSATSTTTVAAGSTMTGAKARFVAAKLRGNNARGWGDMGVPGNAFAGFIHPDVSVDLRQETGAAGWAEVANRQEGGSRRWEGLIGKYEGIGWIETPRAAILVDASNGAGAAGTVDVYQTLVVSREAIGFSSGADNGKLPEFIMSPQVDRLRRHHTMGWYWLGGFVVLREEAMYRVETSSSIGTNT